MKRNPNPFLIYGYESPTYFCDREKETAALTSALRNGRNVTLMSPRRIGKTGLIHNAFHYIREEEPQAACFYMDIFATTSLHEFVTLFGATVLGQLDSLTDKVLSAIRTFLTNCRIVFTNDSLSTGKIALEFQPHEAEATLKGIFDYLKQSGRECYIAIDEFQQVGEYTDGSNVEALLRSHIQFCPNLHFIFSGSKSHLLADIFDSPRRPLYRSTEKMHLGILPEDTYYTFAATWMQKAGVNMSAEVFHEIYQQFEGHTWYVQYMLNKIYEQTPQQVETSMLRSYLADIVHTNAEDYQRQYMRLTRNQQQLLKAIGKERSVSAINAKPFLRKYDLGATSSINKALASLIKGEFVYQYEKGYQVYDRFMQLWLTTL